MDIRTREAVRYLGYGRHAIDERTLQLVEDSFKELERIVNAKFTYRIFETTFPDTNELSIGKMKIKSKNLYKNLKGCSQAVSYTHLPCLDGNRKRLSSGGEDAFQISWDRSV